MTNILNFLKLIRLNNLIIILLTQIIIKYALINVFITNFSLNHLNFTLYLIALLFVIAGGYIINDIYDIEIDKINKKEKQIINNKISINTSYKLYAILNIIGIISGFYLALLINQPVFGFIFLFFAFSLFRYSQQFKKSFLIGNLQISFLTGLSIINIGLFDLIPNGISTQNTSLMIFKIIIIYAIFSFMITLIREMIKDVEDVEGDKIMNLKTAAIKLGVKKIKIITIILSVITLLGITYFQYLGKWINNITILLYSLIIQILFVFICVKIYCAKIKTDFNFISKICKLIMIMGIMSIPMFTYLYLN